MTHPAVRAVASDHEVGPGLGLHPRDIPKSRRDGALFLGDTNQLHALFDNAAELAYPSAQQHLGLVLGKVEDESVSRAVPGHVEDEQIPVFGVHMEATHPLAAIDKGVRQAHDVKYLEGPGMNAKRPGLRNRAGAFVDDSGSDATRQQLRGEHQAGRSGADDQHLTIRGSCAACTHRNNAGPADCLSRQKNYVATTYFAALCPPRAPRLQAVCGFGNLAWTGCGRRGPRRS